jgi:tetratricopeptide (TPR) repeat protein/O-antigen ligase
VRVWAFTIANGVFSLFLPIVFMKPQQETDRPISIWADILFACFWAGLWFGFSDMKNTNPMELMWDPYAAILWILVLIYAFFRQKKGDLRESFHLIFFVGFLSAGYGILQYAGRDIIWSSLIQPYGGRPVSTFGNPNFLSSYLMMTSLLSFSFGVYASTSNRMGYWLVALITGVGVLCTLTRSTYVGLFSSYVLFAILMFVNGEKRVFKWGSLSAALFVMFVLLFPTTPVTKLQSPLARFTEMIAAYKSGVSYGPWDQRILIWSSAWSMVKDGIFLGKGWGCFELFYPFYQGHYLLVRSLTQWRTHANNAHNILLEFWSQVGTVGLGLILWTFWTYIIASWKLLKTLNGHSLAISAALLSACVGMVVDNFFGNVSIFFAVPAFLFAWCLGCQFLIRPLPATVVPIKKARWGIGILLIINIFISLYFLSRWKQEIYYFQGFKEARQGLADKSIKSLEKAYAWFPGEVNGNYELGNSYSRIAKEMGDKGRTEDAKKFNAKSLFAYQAALNANPGYDEIHYNLGIVYSLLGQPNEAASALGLALFINPLLKEAYNSLGNVFINLNRPQDAIRIFEQGVAIFPKERDLWNNLGYTYSLIKDDKQAFRAYKNAVTADPGFNQGWHNIGLLANSGGFKDPILEIPGLIKSMETHIRNREFQKALAPALKIAEILPENPDSHLSLGNIYFYLGQTEKSIVEYQKAIEFKPEFSIAYLNLARLYQVSGKLDLAKSMIEKAAQLDPGNQEIQKAKQEIIH